METEGEVRRERYESTRVDGAIDMKTTKIGDCVCDIVCVWDRSTALSKGTDRKRRPQQTSEGQKQSSPHR